MDQSSEGGIVMREEVCRACEGTGMLADDEGWQYQCSVCSGTGDRTEMKEADILSVDENNRLLD